VGSARIASNQQARVLGSVRLVLERFEIVKLDDEFASAFSHEALQCIHRPGRPKRAEPLGELRDLSRKTGRGPG